MDSAINWFWFNDSKDFNFSYYSGSKVSFLKYSASAIILK
jgi:hypothetical protein